MHATKKSLQEPVGRSGVDSVLCQTRWSCKKQALSIRPQKKPKASLLESSHSFASRAVGRSEDGPCVQGSGCLHVVFRHRSCSVHGFRRALPKAARSAPRRHLKGMCVLRSQHTSCQQIARGQNVEEELRDFWL